LERPDIFEASERANPLPVMNEIKWMTAIKSNQWMSLLYQEVPNKRTRPQGNFSCMNSHVSMAGLALGRSFSDPALLKHQKSGLMGRMKRIKIISSTGTESPIFLENINPKVFVFQLIAFVVVVFLTLRRVSPIQR
jgi:hypothetical protein